MNWKDSKTKEEKPLAELTLQELQEAMYVVQKRQLYSLTKLKVATSLENELLKEARRRKENLISLDLADNPSYSKEYKTKKEVIKTVHRSLIRKEKQLNVHSNL